MLGLQPGALVGADADGRVVLYAPDPLSPAPRLPTGLPRQRRICSWSRSSTSTSMRGAILILPPFQLADLGWTLNEAQLGAQETQSRSPRP